MLLVPVSITVLGHSIFDSLNGSQQPLVLPIYFLSLLQPPVHIDGFGEVGRGFLVDAVVPYRELLALRNVMHLWQHFLVLLPDPLKYPDLLLLVTLHQNLHIRGVAGWLRYHKSWPWNGRSESIFLGSSLHLLTRRLRNRFRSKRGLLHPSVTVSINFVTLIKILPHIKRFGRILKSRSLCRKIPLSPRLQIYGIRSCMQFQLFDSIPYAISSRRPQHYGSIQNALIEVLSGLRPVIQTICLLILRII